MKSHYLKFLVFAAFCSLLSCSRPKSNAFREYSPDGTSYVEVEHLGSPVSERIWVGSHGERLLLAEGLPSMCGVSLNWLNKRSLSLRLPEPMRRHLRSTQTIWEGISLALEFHEDGVTQSLPSSDRALRVIVVKDCETLAWDLYLRKASEPNFDDRMLKGWGDESLIGGFDARRRLKSIRWTGKRRLQVEVLGYRSGLTIREELSCVRVSWKFLPPT